MNYLIAYLVLGLLFIPYVAINSKSVSVTLVSFVVWPIWISQAAYVVMRDLVFTKRCGWCNEVIPGTRTSNKERALAATREHVTQCKSNPLIAVIDGLRTENEYLLGERDLLARAIDYIKHHIAGHKTFDYPAARELVREYEEMEKRG